MDPGILAVRDGVMDNTGADTNKTLDRFSSLPVELISHIFSFVYLDRTGNETLPRYLSHRLLPLQRNEAYRIVHIVSLESLVLLVRTLRQAGTGSSTRRGVINPQMALPNGPNARGQWRGSPVEMVLFKELTHVLIGHCSRITSIFCRYPNGAIAAVIQSLHLLPELQNLTLGKIHPRDLDRLLLIPKLTVLHLEDISSSSAYEEAVTNLALPDTPTWFALDRRRLHSLELSGEVSSPAVADLVRKWKPFRFTLVTDEGPTSGIVETLRAVDTSIGHLEIFLFKLTFTAAELSLFQSTLLSFTHLLELSLAVIGISSDFLTNLLRSLSLVTLEIGEIDYLDASDLLAAIENPSLAQHLKSLKIDSWREDPGGVTDAWRWPERCCHHDALRLVAACARRGVSLQGTILEMLPWEDGREGTYDLQDAPAFDFDYYLENL